MANEALLRIKVVTDATQAALGLDKTAKTSSKFGSAMQKAALPAAAAGVALIALGKHALDSASTLQQAQGAVESVYGKSSAAVEKYAQTSAEKMGLAKSAYLNYASLVGAALQNAGFSAGKAADESNKIMQRAADMAATFGGTTADAVEAINAAVARGEYDPLEKYGVSLNATAVNAELAARGQDKLTGKQLANAKANIALEQIYSKTAKAAGQFGREQDTAAGSAAIASANFEDASAALGTALLPAAAACAKVLADMAKWAQKNSTIVLIMAGAIGTLVTAILLYNAAMKIAAIVQTAFNVAMSANVIFLVIVAVIALVAVFVVLYKKVDWFRAAVNATWNAIKTGVAAVISFVKKHWLMMVAALFGPFGIAVALIIKNWDKIKRVAGNAADAINRAWDKIKTKAAAVWDWIKQKVSAVVEAIKTKVSTVKDKAAAVFEAVKTKVQNIMDGVKTAVDNGVQKVKDYLGKITTALKDLVPDGLSKALTGPFEDAKTIMDKVHTVIGDIASAISNLIKKIAGIHWPSVPSGLKGLLGKITGHALPAPGPTPRTYYAPAGVGARGLGATVPVTAGGAGVQINVYGALDPENVARQIDKILTAHYARVGRTVAPA